MINYNILEKNICAWAQKQDDVLALVVIGSRARQDHPADEWSDLDLILFVTNPRVYAAAPTWLSQFGEIWLTVLKITDIGDPEWLVLYSGGLKVDFLLAPVVGDLAGMLCGHKYSFVTSRGVRVLLNKLDDVEQADIHDPSSLEWQQPNEAAFTAVINQFWLSAYRAANTLLRGELWRAKMIIDCELRNHLLCILVWQANAVNGSAYDTWHDGRFLMEWADPQAAVLLPEIFSPFDKAKTGIALLKMTELVDKLGKETAERLNYHYPAMTTARVHGWIVMLLLKLSEPDWFTGRDRYQG